ncbi:hypothetical protein [Rhodococcus wratislaviensis]|uniref:hypothetical protein n=1 Tax=Rhodococcus wratislaviensis TaxID=44752 RepID=UPI0035118F2C
MPKFVLVILVTLFVTGVGLTVWGFLWDAQGKWDNHGFGLNFLTSGVGFCFGAPIALIILGTVTNEVQSRGSEHDVAALSKNAWSDLVASVEEYCTDDRISGLRMVAQRIFVEYEGATGPLIEFAKSRNMVRLGTTSGHGYVPERSTDHEYLFLLRTDLKIAAKNIDNDLAILDSKIGAMGIVDYDWADICSKWSLINGHVRIRRLESGLPRLPRTVESGLGYNLREDRNPMAEFLSHLNGSSSQYHPALNGMRSAPHFLRMLAEKEEGPLLDNIVSSSISDLDTRTPREFMDAAVGSSNRLNMIRNHVRSVAVMS